MQNILRSLARNITTQVSNSTIEGDIKNSFADDISRPTLIDYLNTLEKLFVIEDVNATNLNFRSKYALRTKPKKYFVDPSIATAILDMKPNDLINDLNTFVFMFESLCIRDLKIYMQSLVVIYLFIVMRKILKLMLLLELIMVCGALLKLS